jgi:hypothetical protein
MPVWQLRTILQIISETANEQHMVVFIPAGYAPASIIFRTAFEFARDF